MMSYNSSHVQYILLMLKIYWFRKKLDAICSNYVRGKRKKFCKTGDQDFSIYWKVTLVKLVKEYKFLLLSIQFMKIYPTMILQLDNPLKKIPRYR